MNKIIGMMLIVGVFFGSGVYGQTSNAKLKPLFYGRYHETTIPHHNITFKSNGDIIHIGQFKESVPEVDDTLRGKWATDGNKLILSYPKDPSKNKVYYFFGGGEGFSLCPDNVPPCDQPRNFRKFPPEK